MSIVTTKMTKTEKLVFAEKLVEERGDSNWFKEQYTLARNFHDIETSLEIALEEQNLLGIYQDFFRVKI